MTAFDIYIFTLSLLIIVLLTVVSIAIVIIIMKLSCKLIQSGAEDDKILAEVNKTQSKSETIWKFIDKVVSLIFSVLFLIAFVLSTMVACTKEISMGQIPVFRVVNSDSMSKKHEKNDYLIENNLNDQFDTFDLIITYDVPEEKDLKLYDIVVYRYDDMLVVHRIVQIVHTKENGTYYMLQGDNEPRVDVMPVYYDQMIAIYHGERIPFIGSFIKFMQSPAGWICIVLVIVAMFAGPYLDKKLEKERAKRLTIITSGDNTAKISETDSESVDKSEPLTAEVVNEELSVTDDNELLKLNKETEIEDSNSQTFLNIKGLSLSFNEKLNKAPKITKERYFKIVDLLQRINSVRLIEGKKYKTYKYKNLPIIRFAIRGKTLNAYLGLNPIEYQNTKYIFEDVSSSKSFKNYPMRVKATSERKTRWIIELILDLANKNGLTIREKSTIIEDSLYPFDKLKKKKSLTFKYRLRKSPNAKIRYEVIKDALLKLNGVRVISGKFSETYKIKGKPLVKFAMRGKTLNAFLGLNPSDYAESKYIYTDVSNVKKFKNYSMRLKLTSERQVRWAIELIDEMAKQFGLTVYEKEIVEKKEFSFADLKKKKALTFKYRVRKSPYAKIRYEVIKNELLKLNGVRVITGKFSETYKLKGKPLVKLVMRGKTLNAYVGLNPSDYTESKYIFTNVSNVKKYQNYAMRVRLTSNRQVKWLLELVSVIESEVNNVNKASC